MYFKNICGIFFLFHQTQVDPGLYKQDMTFA